MLIALTGYARAGKDTVGQILVERHGFHRVSFAAALKQMALKLDPILEVEPDLDTAPYQCRLSHIVRMYDGLENAKELPAVRRFLQFLGTEVVRETFGRDAWVRAARLDEALAEYGDVVITDCRFRNEAEAAKRLGGKVVRVTRPGVTSVNSHASEHDLDDWPIDAELHNAGTIAELGEFVAVMVRTWLTELEVEQLAPPLSDDYGYGRTS